MNIASFASSLLATALVALSALSPPASAAQAYPSRPIRLIVPFAAGSTADSVSRMVAEELAKQLGEAVVVENKLGAGGAIGTAEAARANPNGYTLLFASQGSFIYNPVLYSRTGYDPLKDFAPIAMLGGVSNVMVVGSGSPYKSVAEVIAAAKSSRPSSLSYSSSGAGTSHHIAGVLFTQLTGTELLHVPYNGAPHGVLAMISGDVDMGFYGLPVVMGQIRAGKLKALAVTGVNRSVQLPNVTTLDAAGVKGYDLTQWFGIAAPAGTPVEIVNRLHSELNRMLSSPAIREKLIAQGYDLAPTPLAPPAAFMQLIRDDTAKWPAIIKASGAKAD